MACTVDSRVNTKGSSASTEATWASRRARSVRRSFGRPHSLVRRQVRRANIAGRMANRCRSRRAEPVTGWRSKASRMVMMASTWVRLGSRLVIWARMMGMRASMKAMLVRMMVTMASTKDS